MTYLSYDDWIPGTSSGQQCEIRWGNHPYKNGCSVCLFFGQYECNNHVSGDQFVGLKSIYIADRDKLECKVDGVEVYLTVIVNPEDIIKVIQSGIVLENSSSDYFPACYYNSQNNQNPDQEEDPETITSDDVRNDDNTETIIRVVADQEGNEQKTEENVVTITNPPDASPLVKKRSKRWYKPWTWYKYIL